jgi:hypothetical protein
MIVKRELSPAAFWALAAAVAMAVVGGVYLLARPDVGEQAQSGSPPPIPSGASSGPPAPPPEGFPKHE